VCTYGLVLVVEEQVEAAHVLGVGARQKHDLELPATLIVRQHLQWMFEQH
jgi:hypothetical protein